MVNEPMPCPFCGELPQMSKEGIAMHACRVLDREIRVPVAVWNRRAERTCRPEVCDDGVGAWGVYCSECGYRFAGPHGKREVPEHMATRRDIMPCYCPSCGSRVEVNE